MKGIVQRIIDGLECFLFALIVDITTFLKDEPRLFTLIMRILGERRRFTSVSSERFFYFAMLKRNQLRIAVVRRRLNDDQFGFPRVFLLKPPMNKGQVTVRESVRTGMHCIKARICTNQ